MAEGPDLRKLVRIGGSYYVSLPSRWVREHGLDKARVVRVRPRRGVLEVYPELPGRKIETAKLRADEYVARRILSAYLDGAEVMELEPGPGFSIEDLEKILRLLVGAEIVEESEERVVVQCFLKEDYDIGSLVARMDRISRSMYVDAIRALCAGSAELARSVVARDDKVDKLLFLIVRLIRSTLKVAPTSKSLLRLLDYRLLVRSLERIGDHGEAIARLLLERAAGPARALLYEELHEAALEISEGQKEITESFLREDLERAVRAEKKVLGVAEKLESFRESLLDKRSVEALVAVDRLLRIAEELADISSLVPGW